MQWPPVRDAVGIDCAEQGVHLVLPPRSLPTLTSSPAYHALGRISSK